MSPSAPTRLTTARTVDVLKPRATRYAVPDSQVAGLDLRVYPDGRKVWTLRYRAHGQQRRLKLGEYGPTRMSLAAARTAANQELRKVDGGTDPQAERRAAKVAAVEAKRAEALAKRDSIEALCAAYVDRHAKPRKRTWRDDQSKINREILPAWKGRPVSSITRRDCEALVQAIADRQKQGKGVYANRVAALLSKLFGFAVKKAKLIEANIAWQLDRPGVEFSARPEAEQEDKPYDDDEIRAIWQATAALEPAPRALYRLQLLTGARPGEVAGMLWDEIDGSWWTIPAARTKNKRAHRVYLTPQALDALQDVPRIKDEPHVFVGFRGKRQIAELNTVVFAQVRPRVKPRHALRDTTATGMVTAGVSVPDVSHVLNHSLGLRVTKGYIAHSYDKEKRLALGKWARRLDAILTKATTTATVVAMVGAR